MNRYTAIVSVPDHTANGLIRPLGTFTVAARDQENAAKFAVYEWNENCEVISTDYTGGSWYITISRPGVSNDVVIVDLKPNYDRANQQRRNEITEKTGYDLGEKAKDAAEVRAYFTPENMIAMFGPEKAFTDAAKLQKMADYIINTRWHME